MSYYMSLFGTIVLCGCWAIRPEQYPLVNEESDPETSHVLVFHSIFQPPQTARVELLILLVDNN